MESSSVGMGLMAVFAVSGSVVFVARHVHKRLLSDFMNKIECELHHGMGSKNCIQVKKRVRFAENVMERKAVVGEAEMRNMPLNRQMLYRGIIKYKNLNALNSGVWLFHQLCLSVHLLLFERISIFVLHQFCILAFLYWSLFGKCNVFDRYNGPLFLDNENVIRFCFYFICRTYFNYLIFFSC